MKHRRMTVFRGGARDSRRRRKRVVGQRVHLAVLVAVLVDSEKR
jgi:ribosome-associated protein YbcJ (S4-like RNA binding protein)